MPKKPAKENLVNQELLTKIAELNKKSRDCLMCNYEYDVVNMAFNDSYKEIVHERLW